MSESAAQNEPDPVSPAAVFISHVHEDKPLADAFSILIQDITAGSVATFSSSDNSGVGGMRYGEEWFSWIKEKVDAADHVVALLTQNSVGRPWILFEAGLGKANPSTSVFGVALGIGVAEASVGPFGVFQNSESDKPAVVKLCKQLIARSHANPRDEVIGSMVDQFLDKVATHLAAVGSEPVEVEDVKTAAVLQGIEDLKFLVRDREPGPSRRSSRRMERDMDRYMHLMDFGRPGSDALRLHILAGLAEESGMIVESEVLRYLAEHRRSSKDNVQLLERMVMTMRPDGREDSYVYELLHHELRRTVETLERGATPGAQ